MNVTSPEVFAWHLTTGTVTRDEARAIVFGLDVLPDGLGAKPLDPAGVSSKEPA